VRNGFDGGVVVRSIGYQGAGWPGALLPGEQTSDHGCLPGEDRVYYELARPLPDGGLLVWRRQTRRTYRAEGTGTVEAVLGDDNDERDFSAPGPYGH
jgi:hypothetical protein